MRQSGVTLIELLVVIALVAIVTGMVGGLTLDSLDKVRAKTEEISIMSLLKQSGARAFSTGNVITLKFSGQELSVFSEKKLMIKETFKFLYFNDQQIEFNQKGLPDKFHLTFKSREMEKVLDFKSIFDRSMLFLDSRVLIDV